MSLYLYLLINTKAKKHLMAYDMYDSAVVVAESEQDARKIIPFKQDEPDEVTNAIEECWAQPNEIDIVFLGTVHTASGMKAGNVVCSSYNAS